MLCRPKLDNRHFGSVHIAVSYIRPELTTLVDIHSHQKLLGHTRHVHLIASRQYQKKSNGVWTTTVEKANAGTLGQCLGSWDSLVRKGSSHLNVGHVLIHSNGKFAPAGIPRHPRCDVMDSVHISMLVGKIYWHLISMVGCVYWKC